MTDILSTVLEDMAYDLGIVVQLPPPPTSPSVDSLSLAEPHSPSLISSASPSRSPSRKRPLSPSSALFTPPATPRTPHFLTPHSKRIRATSATSPHHSLSATSTHLTPVKAEVDLLLLSLVRRSPRLLHSTPSRPLSQLLTEVGSWEPRVRSAASTPNKPRAQSQHNRQPKPFLTPQPSDSRSSTQAAFSLSAERRRHSDGLRLSSRRYQAALSLHAPASADTAVSFSSSASSAASSASADHLEVPTVGVRRSPPASPSHARDSAKSSKVLFGHHG